MSAFLSLTLHLAGASSFAYAIYYDLNDVKIPEELAPSRENFGGQAKYLTFLNMVLQLLYFSLCLIIDFAPSCRRLKSLRDGMFASAAFPIGIFVGFIFWSIWAVDRELILPARFDPYFPSWLNHLMHTTVVPLQLGEMLLVPHKYPSRMVGGAVNGLLTLAYLSWINVIYYYGGFWVYPVFQALPKPLIPVFMLFCCSLGAIFFFLGEFINNKRWPAAVASKPKGKQGKGGKKHKYH